MSVTRINRLAAWGGAIVLSLLGVLAFVLARVGAEPLNDDSVVATVDGAEIRYLQIRVSLDVLHERFTQNHGHPPVAEQEEAEIHTEQFKGELAKLRKLIQITARESQAKRSGVTVTLSDIQDIQERITHDDDPPHVVAARLAKQRLLVKALERVYDDGEDSKSVYETDLAKYFSELEWETALRQFAKPSMRDLLARSAMDLPRDAASDDRAVRAFILAQKMNTVIDNELVRTDPEFAEYFHLSKNNPSHPKVQEKSPTYRDAKRHEWWEARYREAVVDIKDERFKDAWPPK